MRNSDKIWPYRSSRSPKAIDLGVNRKPRCDFLSVINSNCGRLDVSPTVFLRYRRLNPENGLFSHPSLVWHPFSGNLLECLDKTYPTKTRGMELLFLSATSSTFYMPVELGFIICFLHFMHICQTLHYSTWKMRRRKKDLEKVRR